MIYEIINQDDEDEEDIKFSLLNYVKGVDDN